MEEKKYTVYIHTVIENNKKVELSNEEAREKLLQILKNLRIVPRIPDLILSIYIQDLLSDERMYLRVYQ